MQLNFFFIFLVFFIVQDLFSQDTIKQEFELRLKSIDTIQSLDVKEFELQEYKLEIDSSPSEIKDSLLALINYELGNISNDKGFYNVAINYFDTSEAHLRKFDFANSFISRLYTSRGSSYSYLSNYENADADLLYALKFIDTSEVSESVSEYYNNYAYVLDKKEDYSRAEYFYKKSIEIDTAIFGRYHNYVAIGYNNLGYVYQSRGELWEAIKCYKTSLEIRKNVTPVVKRNLARSYNNLATAYSDLREYRKASEYFDYALKIREDEYGKNPNAVLANSISNMSLALLDEKDYEGALELGLKGIKILDKLNYFNHPQKGTALTVLGDIQRALKLFDDALTSYDNAEAIFKNNEGSYSAKLLICYKGKAVIYEDLNEIDKAIQYYQQALDLNSPSNFLNSIVCNNLGNCYNLKDDYDLSNELFLNAINFQYPEDLLNIFDVLDLQFNNDQVHPDIPRFIGKIGVNLLREYELTQDEIKLSNSIKFFKKAISLIEGTLINLTNTQDKFSFFENYSFLYEELLEALDKNEKLNSQDNQEYKLEVVEEAKRIISKQIENKYLVTNNLEFRESIYLLSYLRRRLTNLDGEQLNTKTNLSLRSKIVNLSQKIDSLYNKSDSNSTGSKPSFSSYQNSFPDALSSVSLYKSNNKIYCFYLDQDTLFEKKIDYDTTVSLVSQFKTCLSDQTCSPSEINTLGFKIYSLFREGIDIAIEKKNKLIVSPDDILYLLPFESLVYENQSDVNNYGDIKYLIRQVDIGYSYSLFDIINNSNNEIDYNYIGVAPSFSGSNKLSYNESEVSSASKQFPGSEILLNESATKENYLNQYSNKNIHHFATHAIVDLNDFTKSTISFQESDILAENNSISFSEISNLDFNVGLVLLSACKTGYGELVKGQGLISLAKAFSLAGCSAIMTTLWDLDDKSASIIVANFFENFSESNQANVALSKAKVSFLGSDINDAYKHPGYWANMICIGDAKAFQKRNYVARGIGALLVLLLSWFSIHLIRKYSRSNSRMAS